LLSFAQNAVTAGMYCFQSFSRPEYKNPVNGGFRDPNRTCGVHRALLCFY
jgi:hypothetical protein